MRILVFGATGMAGHVVAKHLLEKGHKVTAFARRELSWIPTIVSDVKDVSVVEASVSDEYDAVINCVGLLNRYCDDHRSESVWVNSYFPHLLAELCEKKRCKFVHLSTDCVFSGAQGGYRENSIRDGNTFYDRTKAMGEPDYDNNLVFRQSIIGPDLSSRGIGLFNWFMAQNGKINGYQKALWNGVTTITLARAIEHAIQVDLGGIYHLVNQTPISKYGLLGLFNQVFRNDEITIEPVDTVVVDKTLINTREDFSFEVPTYVEQIIEMKEWVKRHEAFYPHYRLI